MRFVLTMILLVQVISSLGSIRLICNNPPHVCKLESAVSVPVQVQIPRTSYLYSRLYLVLSTYLLIQYPSCYFESEFSYCTCTRYCTCMHSTGYLVQVLYTCMQSPYEIYCTSAPYEVRDKVDKVQHRRVQNTQPAFAGHART